MTKPHTTLPEAVRALELPKPDCSIEGVGHNAGYFDYYHSERNMRNLLEAAAKLVEQHEAQEPVGEVWADINGTKRAWIEDQSLAKGAKVYAKPTLAATQAGDAWISIDERLPDNEVRVLVWERWATVPFIGYYRAWAKNWAADTEFYDTSGDAIVIDRITQGDVMYWQPIMAPANTRSE